MRRGREWLLPSSGHEAQNPPQSRGGRSDGGLRDRAGRRGNPERARFGERGARGGEPGRLETARPARRGVFADRRHRRSGRVPRPARPRACQRHRAARPAGRGALSFAACDLQGRPRCARLVRAPAGPEGGQAHVPAARWLAAHDRGPGLARHSRCVGGPHPSSAAMRPPGSRTCWPRGRPSTRSCCSMARGSRSRPRPRAPFSMRGRTSPELGRDAPAWFAHLLAPRAAKHTFLLLDGSRLTIEAQASRAILDAWEDLTRLMALVVTMLVLVNGLAFWLIDRALAPFPIIVNGLERIKRGELTFRLPPLPGSEAQAIGAAFNRMAQAVEDNVQAERKAREAETRLEERREMALVVEQRVEEERRSIAHELHDELGESVTVIRSLAQAIVGQTREPAMRDAARLISEEAARLYDAMHGLIPRLMPVSLDTLGLAETLENLVRDWQRRHPSIVLSLRHDLPADLGPSVTLAAYRVVQEGLINALRHAKASHVDIQLDSTPARMRITVADDGVGLDPGWSRPGHFGLRGLAERVERLGGVFSVGNREPRGVCLTAEIPLAAAG